MSQPTRFSGAAIPIPPAPSAGSTLDPATGNLMPLGQLGTPVQDTPQIFHSRAEVPMVPMLVTEDTGLYSKLTNALGDMGHVPGAGADLGIVAPNGDATWAMADYVVSNTPVITPGIIVDPSTGSYCPSMVPMRDTDRIYASIAEIPTIPSIVTHGSTIGDLPLDYAKLHTETPVGTP